MLISTRRNITCPAMVLNNQLMELVQTYKYLGVVVSSNLSWSKHIQFIGVKAKKILGLLYRNFAKHTSDPSTISKLYKALVRPQLEYAAQVWSLHMLKDIQMLEKVQRFALRVCSRNYHLSYGELLEFFNLPSLVNRRLYLSLYLLFSFPLCSTCVWFWFSHKSCCVL